MRYAEVMVGPENLNAARALKPVSERQVFGRSVLLFDGLEPEKAAALGEVRTPSLADVFVAMMTLQGGIQ
jgi:ABC-2 type transport system ATP-binding protein